MVPVGPRSQAGRRGPAARQRGKNAPPDEKVDSVRVNKLLCNHGEARGPVLAAEQATPPRLSESTDSRFQIQIQGRNPGARRRGRTVGGGRCKVRNDEGESVIERRGRSYRQRPSWQARMAVLLWCRGFVVSWGRRLKRGMKSKHEPDGSQVPVWHPQAQR